MIDATRIDQGRAESTYDEVRAVYLSGSVRSVDEAVARMEQLQHAIVGYEPREDLDGLACFNHLYTIITRRVRDGIASGFFEDIPFITQLDIEFANRYFDAIRADASHPGSAPRTWQVLFDRRSNKWIDSMQFAIAGVNAHVNLDLSVAVVNACTVLRTNPRHGRQHADYLRINQIFAEEMKGLRQHYEHQLTRRLDQAMTPMLDAVCNWGIVTFRNIAWQHALDMWALRRAGHLEIDFEDRLDRAAARKGDLILTPLV